MKNVPDAVCWYEGMQLLPQHFQLQALRSETLAARLVGAGFPYFWGVLDFEVDEGALVSGVVRLSSIEAIMPDGLFVRYDDTCGLPLECNVKEAVNTARNRMVTVSLSVPPLMRAGRLDAKLTRYKSVNSDEIPDLSSGENPSSLALWRPDIGLTYDDTRTDLISLPLLKIGQQGGGLMRLPYMPPTPQIIPESLLGRKIAALCALVREKCVFLSGRLRNTHQEDDIEQLSKQMSVFWARLPEIEVMLGSRTAHPIHLYTALAGMAGSLCALNLKAGVPVFPTFDYQELLSGFNAVIEWLEATLEKIKEGYRYQAFYREGASFWAQIPEELQRADQVVIGLRMPNGTADQAAQEWLSQAIIASEAFIPTLVRQRMRGLPVRSLDRFERVTYSMGDETSLFILQTDSEWFDPTQRLLMVVPVGSSIEPWEVLLFIPENAGSANGRP